MFEFVEHVHPMLLAPGFLVAMLAAWGIGVWTGRRSKDDETRGDPGVKFTDAALALLGLLLAFTFSMSLGRHEQRRAMVVAESNAIGDFYTCASLLKEPTRSRLQTVIREYAQHKRDASRNLRTEQDIDKELHWYQQAHGRMTVLVSEALVDGTPIAVSLANTLNNVTSTDATRLAAYRDRLPWIIVLLLFVGAIVPTFLMGLQQAPSTRPHVSGTICFLLMVTMVVFVTLDLNQPQRGTITVSQEPLQRLTQTMEP